MLVLLLPLARLDPLVLLIQQARQLLLVPLVLLDPLVLLILQVLNPPLVGILMRMAYLI